MLETALVFAIVAGAGVYVLYKFGLFGRRGGKTPCSYCPCPGKGDPEAPSPCDALMDRSGRYGQPADTDAPSCRKWCVNDDDSPACGKEKEK